MQKERQETAVTEAEPQAPAKGIPDLENGELPRLIEFLKENGVAVLAGAVVAGVAFLGWSLYRNHRIQQRFEAANMLFNAQSIEQVQQVLTRFPSTPAASLALLVSASHAYDEGAYDYAQSLFTRFLQEHPDHELADQARFALIQCLEAAGRLDEALKGYADFVREHPGHYLESAALMGQGRCLEQLGQFNEAIAVYSNLSARARDERSRLRAESAIDFAKKEMRARLAASPAQGEAAVTFPAPSAGGAAPSTLLPPP